MRLTESNLYLIRPMDPDDIAQASEIDQECFPGLWPPTPFKRDLNNNLARYLVAVDKRMISMDPPDSSELVSEPVRRRSRLFANIQQFVSRGKVPVELPEVGRQETLAGFIGVWFMVDEAHITTLGVRESCRRRGIAELLLISAMDLAIEKENAAVTLEVRLSNEGAQRLYEKCGFRRVGLRRRYYTDNGEDAIIMTTDRITSVQFRDNFEKLKQSYLERWAATPSLR